MDLERFDDYLNEVVAATEPKFDDFGCLIALALLDCAGDWKLARDALDRATNKLVNRPRGKEASQVFEGAIYQIEVVLDPF